MHTYGTGRVCSHPGCGTILSQYNPHHYCDLHVRDAYDPRTVEMDYTTDGKRRCSSCGRCWEPWFKYWHADANSRDGLRAECKYCEENRQRRIRYRKQRETERTEA